MPHPPPPVIVQLLYHDPPNLPLFVFSVPALGLGSHNPMSEDGREYRK